MQWHVAALSAVPVIKNTWHCRWRTYVAIQTRTVYNVFRSWFSLSVGSNPPRNGNKYNGKRTNQHKKNDIHSKALHWQSIRGKLTHLTAQMQNSPQRRQVDSRQLIWNRSIGGTAFLRRSFDAPPQLLLRVRFFIFPISNFSIIQTVRATYTLHTRHCHITRVTRKSVRDPLLSTGRWAHVRVCVC